MPQTQAENGNKQNRRNAVAQAIATLSAAGRTFTLTDVARVAKVSRMLLYTPSYAGLKAQAQMAIAKTVVQAFESTVPQGKLTIAKVSGRYYRCVISNGCIVPVEPCEVTCSADREFYQTLADYARRNHEVA